jgi:hypothetical protein
MMLAAMVAMVLLLAAVPVMADTFLSSGASLNQVNRGSQFAENDADQDLNQDQYQYNPGGAGGDVQFTAGNNLQDVSQFGGDGGAGGTGSQYQYATQDQTQDATATGPTFDADQVQRSFNRAV